MTRKPIWVVMVSAALAMPALATDGPRVHISGPKGCAFFEGLEGDGAAFHALDDEHVLLDFELLDSPGLTCWFDGTFSLVGAPGKVESLTGRCAVPGGDERADTFTLEYTDADHATLKIGSMDEPLAFLACDWPV